MRSSIYRLSGLIVIFLLKLPLLNSLIFLVLKTFFLHSRHSYLTRFHKIILKSLKSRRYNYRNYDLTYLDHDLSLYKRPSKYLMEISANLASAKSELIYNQEEFLESNNIFSMVPELASHGQHYELLYLLAKEIKAEYIVEIGTASGASLASLLSSSNVKFVDTFDLVPLERNKTWLSKESYKSTKEFLKENDSRWEQHLVDLTLVDEFNKYIDILNKAQIVFIDVDHSGKTERALAKLFETLDYNPSRIFVWDDINLSCMLNFWHDLKMDKITATDLGHYSGTGISRQV